MYCDERETLYSRNSERSTSFCDPESDVHSFDSTITKEPLLFRTPHLPISFTAGGQIISMDLEQSVTTVKIENTKKYCLDSVNQRNIEALESFKGIIYKKNYIFKVRCWLEKHRHKHRFYLFNVKLIELCNLTFIKRILLLVMQMIVY